ncbi:hypothetical protein PENTCL1PPCAC_8912 [Pristionchus entomophagus]|uniref:PI3K/PI4K catalytic domain-containing protein n=1 Tax=Pristionchus entomophagus TaxID=358040 RepID=A0AAV5SVF9_9BILA|nr:hypothetical protein PENTCL1PPCAC_8912 [Pristionchus entomophagus]
MSGNEDSLGGPPTSSSNSPYHSISVNVPPPSSRSSSSNLLAIAPSATLPREMISGPGPVCTNDLEVLIRKLQDQNERDDTKLKVLQELWDSFDNFTSLPQYSALMESLVRCFLKLFSETTAQFIAENNTQQLRKLMLEIILRTTGHEVMRHFSKQIQMHMMKIVQTDNEVNAVLAIKILIDHLKLSRVSSATDQVQVTNLLTYVRKSFNEMEMHVRTGRMFEQRTINTTRPSGMAGEDLVIETSLQQCFMQHQLNLDTKNSGASNLMFQLIPRASQSVKVFGEIIHLIMLIYQQWKQAIVNEILDLTQTFIVFTNIRVPEEQMKSETKNQELLNEFHNAQVKALGFFSYLIRSSGLSRQNPIMDLLVNSGDRVIAGTISLLDTCPQLVINQRKELLAVTKAFFTCEALRVKFLPFIPRMFSEKLMIGTAFTANDCLRKMMYEQLADLLHHLRAQLSYPVLCHATYVFSRCLHDPLLPPSMQAMSIRLIMNLCDSFVECEKKNNEPARDLFFGVLESVISKLRVLVLYHLPLMFTAAGGDSAVFRSTEFAASEMHPDDKHKLVDIIANERRHSNSTPPNPSAVDLDEPSLHCTVEGVPELEPRPSSNVPALSAPTVKPPEKGYSSVDSMLAATWTAAGPPMPVHEARSMIRFLVHACKSIFSALEKTKKTDRALTPAEERDTCARLLKYGLQALDVIMINPSSGGVQMRSSSSNRDDKETIEQFATVFTTINPDVFNEIFSNYTPFLIERIAVNPHLQIICNTFLVNPETCARFGSILAQYLLKRMPEMASSNERSSLYLKLFKLIFSAISCTQQSQGQTASQNVEKMIKPWLHQIVRDSMYYSLRGREPTNYFLLLRALFRSIGGGSQDVASIYHEFLPLLPSLLSFLNRMQAGQHRIAMKEIFVELCLTVPVRLSSLLPHLPLLMDPLVCSLSGAHNVAPSTTTRGFKSLRTLELCVDNLQPEYLHEHIAPVRASLIQGLWRVVSKSNDQQSAMLALKILGKFGATNRKMLSEPAPLQSLRTADLDPLCLRVVFERPPLLQLPGAAAQQPKQQGGGGEEKQIKMEVDDESSLLTAPQHSNQTTSSSSNDSIQTASTQNGERTENGEERDISVPTGPIVGELCLSEAVKVALENLRWSSMPDERLLPTGPGAPPLPVNQNDMRRHAAALCMTILKAAIEERGETVEGNMEKIKRKLEAMSPETLRSATVYRSSNEPARRMYVNALTGIAIAVTGKDLRHTHIKFFASIVRQLVTQALLEQMDPPSDPSSCMDGLIVVDVITNALADPVKHEFGHAAVVMLRIACDTCYQAARDVPTFCALPFLRYIVEQLAELCYSSSCVSKLGGTTGLHYVVEEFPRVILRRHMEVILRALVETIVGLAYEVSSGAIELAVTAIDRLIVAVFVGRDQKALNTPESGASSSQTFSAVRMVLPANDEKDTIDDQERIRIRNLMANILVPLLDSADTYTQQTSVKFIEKLSNLSGVSIAELTKDGTLSKMCGRGLCDFPGLSLWKQLGVLNTVEFATSNGVRFEFPPGTDELKTLEVFVELLTRICKESAEKLLMRKTYMLVGASSPTIPHAVSAKFIREGAMRGLCLAYASLPHGDSMDGLRAERILRVAMDGVREREKGMREVAEESILEAHKLRPLPDEVIKTELYKLLDSIEQIKELSNVNARLLCCLIKLNGMLFDERCFSVLMSILRSWDDRTRRSSSDLKQRTTADVEAIESVLLMLPHLPKKPSRHSSSVAGSSKMSESERAVIESIISKQKKMEDEKMETDEGKEEERKQKKIDAILESRPDPSDFVPIVASLASTMHAAFCISRSQFFSSCALVEFLAGYPIRTLRFFLSSDSLSVPARRSLFKRVFEAEGAHALRRAAAQSPYLMRHMLKLQYLSPSSSNEPWTDTDFNKPLSPYDEKTMDHELLTVWMIDVWSRNDVEAYCKDEKSHVLVKTLQEIWRSDDFKTRYMVKTDEQSSSDTTPIRIQFMNTPKYEVPKLFASCFIRYLRENYDNLELFSDLLFVFIGSFATDFSFVRNYLTAEVIPTYPLKWRRDLFSYVLAKFENEKDTAVGNLHIARVMQYALTPVLQYAFERFDVEEILGPRTEPSENEPKNLVIRLSDIITTMGKQLSDTMTLAYYHLSSLIVIHAPNYIHVNNRTSHSNRLRVFMLFAWPCLNSSSMDVTLKFMGHLFLCHIIEKFTINRKIVLQVYHSLTSASQQDSRDIVKKALDILTPQLPIRMDDGQVELVKAVKKALCEESHNVSNVFHCLQTVTRNFKTYFPIKHELLPLLLNGISRLLSYQAATGYTDGKRLAVEVCEMVMKWDIMRKQKIDEVNGQPSAVTVEKQLENLKRLDHSKSTASLAAASGENAVKMEEKKEEGAMDQTESEKAAAVNMPSMEEQLKPMPKDQMDQVVNILFKIATSPTNLPGTPPAHAQAAQEVSRRSIALLRAALKPALWGDIASIKIAWLEKQLTITPEQIQALQTVIAAQHQRVEHHAISGHFMQASQTMEVLAQLTVVMPKQLALATIRPLQKALMSCVMVQSAMLTRTATALVSRLMDNSGTGSCGLDDYEVLSQFVGKYINDQFVTYDRSSTAMITTVYTAFNLLRAMCQSQPAYLDNMCMQNMIKVLVKAAREFTAMAADANREKVVQGICDTATLALDLLRPRVSHLTPDQRRQIACVVIHPFCDTNSEKLLDGIIKLTRELIVSHTDELTANPGLSIVVKLSNVIRTRFRSKGQQYVDLAKLYLQQLVLYIFEHDVLRRTEFAAKLEDAYYWGLTNPILMMDDTTRNAFLSTFVKHVPCTLPARLMYIFAQHDWTLVRETFWIKHALFLLVRCAFPADPTKVKHNLNLRETATFGATIDWLIKDESMEEEEKDEPMETGDERTRLSELLGERRNLLSEARGENLQKDILDHLMGLIWAVQDPSMVRTLFTRMFTSIWAELHPQERHQLQTVLPNFLSSATHMAQASQQVSALSVIIEALSKCQPPFQFAPALIKYVSSRHRTFYLGMLMLEEEASQCEILTERLKEVAGPELGSRFAKQLDALESLNALYSDMNEFDQQTAVWRRRAFMPETVTAVEAMAKGDFAFALNLLEDLQIEHLERLERLVAKNAIEGASDIPDIKEEEDGESNVAVAIAQYETDAWTRMHSECLMNLGHWSEVEELANLQNQADAKIMMRAASHRQEPFLMMRQCKEQLSACLPPDFVLQYQQYSALIAVMDGMGDTPTECRQVADRATEEAFALGVSRWRMLPSAVGVSHLKLLQMCHMVQDLSDASAVTCSLHPTQPPFSQPLISELKGVIKTWRTWSHNNGAFFAQGGTYNSYRSPSLHDDLPITADFFNIRKRVFVKLSRVFDDWIGKGLHNQANPQLSMGHIPLPSHSLIHTQILVARAFRSAKLYEQAEHALNLVHSESSMPVASVVAKIVEHVKLLRAWANDETTEEGTKELLRRRALQVTEEVNMDDVCKEFFSRIYSQRGLVLGDLGDAENAKQTFSIAVALQDPLQACHAYSAWAKHLDKQFQVLRRTGTLEEAGQYGAQAVLCYVEGAKIEHETKARRYIARAIWLARLIAEVAPQSHALSLPVTLEKAARSCHTNYWIEWLPQLCLDVKKDIGLLGGFIATCARIHPVHTYYVMRQQMSAKNERIAIVEEAARNPLTNCTISEELEKGELPKKYFIFPQMTDLCSLASERRPSDILAMERMLSAIDEMKDIWAERQLRAVIDLQKELFQCLHSGQDTNILSYRSVGEIARRWRERLEKERREGWNRKEYIREIDIRRSEDERLNEEEGDKEESQFISSFSSPILDFLSRKDARTIELAAATVEWRRILEKRIELLPKSIPLRLSSQFLSSFCAQSATIDLPGDLFALKNLQYMSTITRFGPHYQIGVKGDQCVKSIIIRSQSGKTSLYFVRKIRRESGARQASSRMPQLMRALDNLVQSDRGTCQRFLKVIPPAVVYCGVSELVEYTNKKECGFFLDEVLLDHLTKEVRVRADELVVESEKERRRLMERREGMSEESARMEVYRSLCGRIPSDLLLKMVQRRVPDATHYYLMRKSLVSEWALHAGLEFALRVTPSLPSSILVDFGTGRSTNPNSRIDLAKGALMDDRIVPFRVSDNMDRFMGFTKEGHFAWSLQSTLGMLNRRKPELYLRPMVWDCVAEEDCKLQLAEVNAKTENIIKMIKNRVRGANDSSTPEDEAFGLLRRARDPANLSRMPVYWHPWF